MNFFPEIKHWQIPKYAWTESFLEMARDGSVGNEGISLWLGDRQDDGNAVITHLVLLRGPHIEKSPVNITILPQLLREVHQKAREEGVVLLGQIHSHGPLYGVNLSPTDREYGIKVPNYLSVVAPDFAMRGFTGVAACGVHEFHSKSGFRRLRAKEVTSRLALDLDNQIRTIIVGT